MFGKVDITKWLEKEIHATELALLVAEDELAAAQLRVNALKERGARLQAKAAVQTAPVAISPAIAAYDRARNDFNRLRTVEQ